MSDAPRLDPMTVLASERAVPAEDAYQGAWHTARYRYAAPLVPSRDVLDAGFGEGYGADLLAKTARSVTAIDYSPIAVEHARRSYRRENLRFELADLSALSGFDGPFDVVTCFEVIEHLADHDGLLAALGARLRSGGTLVLSTPNLLYAGAISCNPYHVSEIEPAALRRELRRHFSSVKLIGQLDRADTRRATAKLIVDPLYLRRRVGLACTQRARGRDDQASAPPVPAPPEDFRFSRALARVSPAVVAIAVK